MVSRSPRKSPLIALVATLVAAVGLLPGSAGAVPPDDSPGAQFYAVAAFDLVILRTMGMCALIVGTGLFLPSALVSSPGGRDAIGEAWDRFVSEPAAAVFERPLGEF